MIEPYYKEDGITLYNAKCEDVLPQLTGYDLVLTDPPYGTGWIRGGGKKAGEFKRRKETEAWDVWSTDWMQTISCEWKIFCPYQRIGELAERGKQTGVAWWKKTNPAPFASKREPIVISKPMLYDDWTFESYNGDCELHPTQKPVDLVSWLMLGNPFTCVVDPFAGSGTTLVAAKRLGRRAIGIEMSEAYCQIAVQRLSQKELFGIENGHGT